MKRSSYLLLAASAWLALFIPSHAQAAASGPKHATVLIIRHAEKPESGDGLTAAGEKRAAFYVGYFENFQVNSQPLKLDYLFAARDSKGSERPVLTVQPLSEALRLPINGDFKNRDYPQLADRLRSGTYDNKSILICWHHGEIPELLRALGANPDQLLPKGKWPKEMFGLVIQLRYDGSGHLAESRTIHEPPVPGS